MEGRYYIFLDNTKTVINAAFPNFRRTRCGVDRLFFNFLHASIGYYRAYQAAHSTAVELFVEFVNIIFKDEVVVGLKKKFNSEVILLMFSFVLE